MGAFIVNGLTPGPFLFQERPDLVWAVIASFMIGNVMLLILNLPFVGLWARLLRLPYQYVCVATLLFASRLTSPWRLSRDCWTCSPPKRPTSPC